MIGESVNVVDEGVTSHMTMEPRKIQEPMNNIGTREINYLKIIIIEIFQEAFNYTCMYSRCITYMHVHVYLYRYMYMYLYMYYSPLQ